MKDISRVCFSCKERKPIGEFPKRSGSRSGHAWKCKKCTRQNSARWRTRNREKSRMAAKRWRKNNPDLEKLIIARYKYGLKRQVLSHYSGGEPRCACCSELHIDFLTIDHVNGGGNEHRRHENISGSTSFYRWLRDRGFPDGFQVLCWNCNCAKRDGICPHKRGISLEEEINAKLASRIKKPGLRLQSVQDFMTARPKAWLSRSEIQNGVGLEACSKQYVRSLIEQLLKLELIEVRKESSAYVRYRLSRHKC